LPRRCGVEGLDPRPSLLASARINVPGVSEPNGLLACRFVSAAARSITGNLPVIGTDGGVGPLCISKSLRWQAQARAAFLGWVLTAS
jgi:hypothetical protein